jgi:SAM-dependent methyltransferase
MMSINEANHAVAEEVRFETDFYRYLELPENASRYTPACDYLSRRFRQPFRLLDLGCGTGILARYLDGTINYLGVDHSAAAIETARAAQPSANFVCADIVEQVTALRRAGETFHAVVLCGVLFHCVEKESLQRKSDSELVDRCLHSIIKPGGCVVIIAPFAYRDDPEYSLFEQARWKLAAVQETISELDARIEHLNMTLQIGLEEHIGRQTMVPDWFLPARGSQSANRFSGHYLGSWTLIMAPGSREPEFKTSR